MTARFLNTAGAELGSVRVGPVTRDDRKRLTVLVKRTAQANVPPNTRSIAVAITVTADGNGANHAFVDNLADARQSVDHASGEREGVVDDPLFRHDARGHGETSGGPEGEARDVHGFRQKSGRLQGAVRRPLRYEGFAGSDPRQGGGCE